jgi:hypothetical protein
MTQYFPSILSFVAQLHAVERDLGELMGEHGHNSAIVAKACEIVAKKARSKIGKPQEGWPALAPSTRWSGR